MSGARGIVYASAAPPRSPGCESQVEAVMRLPVPPGAAVTRAVLHVGSEFVEGAFVARDRAREIYRSITERLCP